jgi:hypothetical protein
MAVMLALLLAGTASAERIPQPRSEADLVLAGTVARVTSTDKKFGSDGVMTTYVAEVKVSEVEKGKGAKAGETVKVTWFNVTKTPSRPLPGAYGQAHKLKAKDNARFWLMKSKGPWIVIYNKDGVEKLKQ